MKQAEEYFREQSAFPAGDMKSGEDEVAYLQQLKLAFDSMQDGAVIITSDGCITHVNKAYGEFLGIKPEEFIGRHCTEVIENTRLHIVAQTGKSEINFPQRIRGRDVIVQRYPFFRKGRVIGVYGQIIFDNVSKIKTLANKLSVLESKVQLYENELINLRSTRYTIDSIIGVSEAITALKKEALLATSNNFPVLITGESGTGKELFAQAIHHASPRSGYPFVRLNCAAIPGELMEAELFGYDKGAFTGARDDGKPGKFELADKGSIFLDEIGELPLKMQPKLLRILEEKEFERVGGTKLIRSDFRLIAATNRNLEEMMAKGTFRRDLYYRLNVISLHPPPLRERREDILPLAEHLLHQMSREVSLGKMARKIICNAEWPGNARELLNVLEQAFSRFSGKVIQAKDLPYYLRQCKLIGGSTTVSTLKQAQACAEKEAIRNALEHTEYHKSRAAEILGIHRTLLYKKAAKYGIPLTPEEEL